MKIRLTSSGIHTRWFTIAIIIIFQSCAVHRDNYKDASIVYDDSNASDSYTSFFTIANGGAFAQGPSKGLYEAMGKHLSTNATENDFLLFLGDNIHSSNVKDKEIASQLQLQLDISTQFQGTSLFVPGEKEWNDYGVKGLEDIETYIEDFYQEKDHFIPKNGCPLEVIDINDHIELILINSQWYIEDWSKSKGINDKCELKTRIQFETLLASEMRKARHKTVLIAMHHPLYSNGIYGGEVPSTVFYKPTSENLFIPFVGGTWAFLRSQGGLSKQDRYNPLMNDLMNVIKQAAFDVPKVIVMSGHERSMQYINDGAIKQIISGTGSTVKPARLGKRGLFTSTKPGFTEVRLYDNGASTVHYYALENNNLKETYKNTAFAKAKKYNIDQLPESFPKKMSASIYPAESINKTDAYERFWGKHYRYIYGLSIEAPVAVLDTLYGGLKVERAGGGNQTKGLRLVTKDDKEYNMRAIAKDPIAFLKSAGYNDLDATTYFKGTVPASVIEDFYTAAHPFGAFAIPRLAGALNIPHTHPKLFYVPKQKALGDFNETYGDELYMIVEKPDGDFENSHMFHFSEEVESTQDLFKELRESEEHILDERMYIRARIFDMLIGDWDRHEDQWRWAQSKEDEEGGITTYTAVPRDRDQVFAKFDGKFIESLQKIMSGLRQFGNYGPDLPYVEQFSESAINLDRALIQRSDKNVWLEEVAFIQKNITPQVVKNAFKEAPVEVQDAIWLGIQNDLLSRKEKLTDILNRYYKNFSKFQVIKGTDKDDHFKIINLPDGDIRVVIHRIKDGEKGTLLLDKVYKATMTEEIWVYGLDDKDVFIVDGNHKTPIKVVIVGGLDEDTYEIKESKNVVIYDQKSDDNIYKHLGNARTHIDDIYENHIYDSERRPDTGGGISLSSIYNPDDGFSPRISYSKSKLGFERNPFTTKIEVDAAYIPLTQAGDFAASWHKSHLFHDWNFKIFGRSTTANYTENFFGLGNTSENESSSFDSNRVALQYQSAGIGFYYNGEYGTAAGINAFYSSINVDGSQEDTTLKKDAQYAVFEGIYFYRSVDEERFPTRGMEVEVKGRFYDELTSTNTVGMLDPSITFWNAIDSSRALVFKTTVSSQLRFGEEIPFYNGAILGGENGLRSYRANRFIGKQALSGSIDFAYRFKPLRTAFFPLRISSFIGYDTGRVWITEEQDKTLHYSYGGGVNVSTAGAIKAMVQYFNGPEGGRLGFGLMLGL